MTIPSLSEVLDSVSGPSGMLAGAWLVFGCALGILLRPLRLRRTPAIAGGVTGGLLAGFAFLFATPRFGEPAGHGIAGGILGLFLLLSVIRARRHQERRGGPSVSSAPLRTTTQKEKPAPATPARPAPVPTAPKPRERPAAPLQPEPLAVDDQDQDEQEPRAVPSTAGPEVSPSPASAPAPSSATRRQPGASPMAPAQPPRTVQAASSPSWMQDHV